MVTWKEIIDWVTNEIRKALSSIWDAFTKLRDWVADQVSRIFETVAAWVNETRKALGDWVKHFSERLDTLYSTLTDWTYGLIENVYDYIASSIETVYDYIVDQVNRIESWVRDSLTSLTGYVDRVAKQLYDALAPIGYDIAAYIGGQFNLFIEAVQSLPAWFCSAVFSLVEIWIDEFNRGFERGLTGEVAAVTAEGWSEMVEEEKAEYVPVAETVEASRPYPVTVAPPVWAKLPRVEPRAVAIPQVALRPEFRAAVELVKMPLVERPPLLKPVRFVRYMPRMVPRYMFQRLMIPRREVIRTRVRYKRRRPRYERYWKTVVGYIRRGVRYVRVRRKVRRYRRR